MSTRCSVCQHPDRQAIEHAIAGGDASLRELARRYALGKSAVRGHSKHHMRFDLVKPGAADAEMVRESLVAGLRASREVVEKARREGRHNLMLEASESVVGLLKQLRELDEATRDVVPKMTAAEEERLERELAEMSAKHRDPAFVETLLQRITDVREGGDLLWSALRRLLVGYPDFRQRVRTDLAAIEAGSGYPPTPSGTAQASQTPEEAEAPPEPPLSAEEQARVVAFEPPPGR